MFDQRHAFHALLSSPLFTGGNIEEKRAFCSEHVESGEDEESTHPLKKRRLSTEQVQFLERSFEAENKLEPERKVQLAKDLGLQPRQVAVWFQNRRARWKTKQLERDYHLLKSHYENLTGDYDNLLKEKDKLKAEVTFLTDKMHSQNEDRKSETKNMETIDKAAFHSESGFASAKNSPTICKHEDFGRSGTDSSGVLYEDSSRHVNSFEVDESDEEEEEDEGGIGNQLLPLTYPEASALSCNDMFAMDDQAQIPWWEWP